MSMKKEAAEARRAYKRKWAAEHPESVRKSQEKYWAKKAAQMKEQEQKAAAESAQ